MKHGWEYRDFEKCLEKVIYTSKLQSSNYKESGKYPIVSQEECLISGYWDNEEDVFHLVKPIVVFGDHTRVLKYIDFDFVLGADGVKILQPTNDLKAKFLYYYLKWYNVPSLGYSRHYKLLKECSVPIPPLPVQEQICSLLDKMNRVIEAKKEQLKELDNLAQAIFYDMFGDPVENEKGWEVKDINDICSLIVRGPFGSALKREFFVKPDSTTYKVYEQKHAINKSVDIGDYHISKEKFTELKRFEVFPKDIIMSCSGTIGELFQIPDDAPRGIMNQALLKFTLNKLVCPSVFLFLMGVIKNNMVVHGCGLQNIGSVKEIKQIKFGLPPLSLQQSFARKIEAIKKQKELIIQSIREAQTLFDAKMDYYFGE